MSSYFAYITKNAIVILKGICDGRLFQLEMNSLHSLAYTLYSGYTTFVLS